MFVFSVVMLIRDASIVFSAWKKTLNLASTLCTENNIAHLRIDGETPQSERPSILERFANDASISSLLMTLGTGALG
jgi:SWI/SNF-related matrix-associated actin-dependent regulator of chromatin subfamily A3